MKKQPYRYAFFLAIVITLGHVVTRFVSSGSSRFFADFPAVLMAVTFCAAYLVALVSLFLLNLLADSDKDTSVS